MPKLIIDGTEIEVADGITLIQACEQAGVEIPRFCYHERLSIAGNCRMCLVEVAGMPKPIASCALGVNDMRPGPNGEPPESERLLIWKSDCAASPLTEIMDLRNGILPDTSD